MRVLVTDRTGAHSIWTLMNAIAASLVAEGHEVVFCRSDDRAGVGTPPVPAGVGAVDIEIATKRHVWDLYAQYRVFEARFRQLVRDFRPDIVHTNFCVPGIGARLVAAQEGVPAVVSTQHELYTSMHPHYRWGLRLTERCTDAVIYVSRAVARSFGRSAVPFDRSATEVPRHAVIYNGIDMSRLDAAAAAAGPVEPGKIVCVGRLMPVKGQRVLVEAMPAVLRAKPDAQLVVIGAGPDEGRLCNSVERLGLWDRVRFAGWLPQDSAFREMATAAVVAIPSDGTQEGFGLTLVEALAVGAPVVASRIPVFEEIASSKTHGVRFFSALDRTELARALLDVLDRSPNGGREPRTPEHLRAMFSVERMVADYLTLYERLLARAAVRSEPCGVADAACTPQHGSNRWHRK